MKFGRSFRSIALSAWILAVLASAILLGRIRVENPPDLWQVEPPSPEQRLWRFTKEQFGQRELLLVGIRDPSGSSPRILAAADTLEGWLSRQPEIASVFGPREARDVVRRLQILDAGGRAIQSLRRAVLSDDHTIGLIYVSLRRSAGPRAFQTKSRLVSRIEREGGRLLPAGSAVLLAGQPAVNASLQEMVRNDALASVPLALAAMLLVLGLTMGATSLGPLAALSASVIALVGGLALSGVSLSAATIVALPITAVVGLSYSTYVAATLVRVRDPEAAFRQIGAPLFWAYATTVVSILSFVLTPVPALRLFAVATASGVTLAAVAALTLMPVLHRRSVSSLARRPGLERWGFRAYAWTARRPRWTAAAWAVLALLGLAGLLRLRLEPNNFLAFFPRGHKVMVAHQELDRAFGGSIPIEVLARTQTPDAAWSEDARDRLRRFVEETRRLQPIGPALTPPGPMARRLDPELSEPFLAWFRAKDPHYTRALFSLPVLPTSRARVALRSLDSLATALSDPRVRIRVTGVLPASIPLLQALVSIQIWNLGSLVLAMLGALAIAARGFRAGTLLLIPNLVPLLAVIGAMGAAGVALDFTTVTILSMLLGIAVDNTIHLRWAVRGRAPGPARGSIPRAVRHVSEAATLSAATAVAGFCILLLSPFTASQRVGLFMAIGLAVAWLADMTLTPMLVSLEVRRVATDRPESPGDAA